jgi:GTP:adenosylcobinamide-phosphate guanylyltransferase
MTALVLAGERAGPSALLEAEDVATKADIDIHGRPMLDRVLAALEASGLPAPYHVAGAHQVTQDRLSQQADRALRYLPGAPGPAGTVLASLETLQAYPVLITTSDHPLLSTRMIHDFAKASLASGADLTVGFAEKPVIEAAWPRASRTYFPIGGRRLSGCNLFMAATPDALKAVSFWRGAEVDRKHPFRIARRFGLLNALRMIRPGISLGGVFDILSARLGCRVQPVLMDQAEAAIDVDKPDDLALVREILSKETG